jgi:hypothetical protein
MSYQHLRIQREQPLTQRHPRKPKPFKPIDAKMHGASLLESFGRARSETQDSSANGFDERRLIKIKLRDGDKSVPDFQNIPGIQIISQEPGALVIAFATESGLDEFEKRLTTLARDGTVTRKELIFAVEAFELWTPEERTGAALKKLGLPAADRFILDAELWPLERTDQREQALASFREWLKKEGIEALDEMRQPSLLMVRLRCSQSHANLLLKHRDVRTLDLPPNHGVAVQLLMTDINNFPPVASPPQNAPAVAVLDSGLTLGHPLLQGAGGDAQGYVFPDRKPEDERPWHGTFVAGIALYGDVRECIQASGFVPTLKVVSGKVFNDDGQDQTTFVEKAVEAAVRELNELYQCKVFNLSYGDLNKIYDGGHLRGLAYTLDRLSRELDVLFVVSTGNISREELPEDVRANYPRYLLEDSYRLLDPATALNALTVGGLAKYTQSRNAQKHPNTLESNPIAQANQPFPLTRVGPSLNKAIKPDFVEHAGNIAETRQPGRYENSGLGVVSLNGGFASSSAFAEDIGTSYAAPALAHKAAKLQAELPDASQNLLRAVLATHATWPAETASLFSDNKSELTRVVGYGQVDEEALFRSLDSNVTLLTEERIENNKHHFFELPVPASFWKPGARNRKISVALAYSPAVRTTRIDYRMSKLWFTFVDANSLDEVVGAFQKNREEGMGERSSGRWLSNKDRKEGTLQLSSWTFKRPITKSKVFVIVTRQDSAWSTIGDELEPYALAISIEDREQVGVQLYDEVKAVLKARAQNRARARV